MKKRKILKKLLEIKKKCKKYPELTILISEYAENNNLDNKNIDDIEKILNYWNTIKDNYG